MAGTEDNVYDVLIIGGSHAGLSAALTLSRALHRCAILDSSAPRDVSGSEVRLVSGWNGEKPSKMRDAQVSELKATGIIDFVPSGAIAAKKISNGTFEATSGDGVIWKGRKMLLAIGMQEIYPSIPGYAENYGASIFHCMFCYGYEQSGSTSAGLLATGILADPAHAITNAKDALKFVENVIVFTDGNDQLKQQLSDQLPDGMSIDNRSITAIRSSENRTGLYLDFSDKDSHRIAFLVHKPDMVLPADLVADLGLETVPGIGIKVSPPFNQTSLEGVFAAGDCCTPMRNIPNALSTGAAAGCGLARQLPPSTRRLAAKARTNL